MYEKPAEQLLETDFVDVTIAMPIFREYHKKLTI